MTATSLTAKRNYSVGRRFSAESQGFMHSNVQLSIYRDEPLEKPFETQGQ